MTSQRCQFRISGGDLQDCNLSGSSIQGAEFEGTFMYAANFDGANLRGSQFYLVLAIAHHSAMQTFVM